MIWYLRGGEGQQRGGPWIEIRDFVSEYNNTSLFVILLCLLYFVVVAVRREAGRRKRPRPRTLWQRIRRQINSDDIAATAHALTIPPLERTFANHVGKYIVI